MLLFILCRFLWRVMMDECDAADYAIPRQVSLKQCKFHSPVYEVKRDGIKRKIACLLILAPASGFTDNVLVLALVLTDYQWHLFLMDFFKPIRLHNVFKNILGSNWFF